MQDQKSEFDVKQALSAAWINPEEPITPPPTLLAFGGVPVASLGNISLITGKAKSMKTFFTALIMARLSGAQVPGIEVTLPDDCRPVFFDTEQARHHVQAYQQRVALLAGDCKAEVFALRPHSPRERIQIIEAYLREHPAAKLVFIDGIRDLITDINSPDQATEISTWLLKLTGELNIHIVTVLHQNKGDGNARGHVGSELVNKAETTITVTKDKSGRFSVVDPEYTRGREFEPFAFEVDDEGLPRILEDWEPEGAEIKPSSAPASFSEVWHRDALQHAFRIEEQPRYSELAEALKVAFQHEGHNFGITRIRNFITYYKDNGFIKLKGKERSKDAFYQYVPYETVDF